MAPRAALGIAEVGVDVLPPGAVPLGVRRIAGRLVEGGGGGGGLGGDPVHPLAYDGAAGPVDGVDESVRAVDRPTLPDGGVEEGDGIVEHPGRGRRAERGTEVQGEPGPLEPVADGGTERP